MITATLGLDNIAVAFALGPLQIGARRTLLLGFAFGMSEAAMMLLGATLGREGLPAFTAAEAARAGLLATLAVAVLGLAWVKYRPAAFIANRWALIGLSLLLGLDNLIAGTTPGADVSPTLAAAAGALTGALAAAACAAGELAIRPAARWGAVASAIMLMALAVAKLS
jgi:putative Mn2+ efflux pump MntP